MGMDPYGHYSSIQSMDTGWSLPCAEHALRHQQPRNRWDTLLILRQVHLPDRGRLTWEQNNERP